MNMIRNLLFLSFWLFLGTLSHAQTGQNTVKDPVEEKTNTVVTRLSLDENKSKAVYNVFSQTEKRIADLALGTPDYTKHINYINEERLNMLQSALSPEEFDLYKKFYGASDNNEINSYIKKNNAFLTKKAADDAKAKKENEKLMQADKLKIKKEEEKQKMAEKKAAEKEKAAAKKTAEKEKAAAKKAATKQKAEAKKEKEKEKRAAIQQKKLEKKQKELDKKLNKK
jgi:hypothetical protein